MSAFPLHLMRDVELFLFDFDGVITTEAEDVSLKVQTLSVFAAIAKRFDERALKLVRLAGEAVYRAGNLSLGPVIYEAAHLLKPPGQALAPTLDELVDACVGNLDYRNVSAAPAVIHRGLDLLEERRVRLGVFSNGIRENALRLLQIKGLTTYFPEDNVFDAISTRDEAGRIYPKPNPEGYRRVLDAMSVDPKRCVFIDNSRKNVQAAKKHAGLGGVVYIGRRLKAKDRGIIDHSAPSLEALMTQLTTRSGPRDKQLFDATQV